MTEMETDTETDRALARQRTEAYRDRRRHGRVLVPAEVAPQHLAALEHMSLLDVGDRDKASIGWAVAHYLDSGPQVSALGDALWPPSRRARARLRHDTQRSIRMGRVSRA